MIVVYDEMGGFIGRVRIDNFFKLYFFFFVFDYFLVVCYNINWLVVNVGVGVDDGFFIVVFVVC